MVIVDYEQSHTLSNKLDPVLIYMHVIKALLFFRIFHYNAFGSKMIDIAEKTLPSYANLTLLLFFLILNYALLGI
jgi:hypothetical protein